MEWLGKAWKIRFEQLDIQQKGLDYLQKMSKRLSSTSDMDTKRVLALTYANELKVKDSSLIWNLYQVNSYFKNYNEINPKTFLGFVSQRTRKEKNQIYHLVRHIFNKDYYEIIQKRLEGKD